MKKYLICFTLIMPFVLVFGQTAKNPCQTASHAVVQPFLGEWEEYSIENGMETSIGKLSTQLDVADCMLTQTFSTPDSTFSYRSQAYVNPTSQIWEETYVFNSGRSAKYLWIVNGDELYTLRINSSYTSENQHRLLYTDVQEDEYLVIQQGSTDGGRNWVSKDSTRIKRIQ